MLASIYSHAGQYLVAITALGTFVMAFIETLKNVTPIRRWYQCAYLRRWLLRRAQMAPTDASAPKGDPFSTPPDSQRAIQDLIKLSTGGDDGAFFSLPIDQMCGLASSAAQAVMDYPDEYPDLLRSLAPLAELADLRTVISQPPQANANPAGLPALAEARAHVNTQAQRSLDAFRISAGYQWQKALQIASFVLSIALTFAAQSVYSDSLDGTGHHLLKAVLLSLAGGFLAPFARDIMAAVQGMRP